MIELTIFIIVIVVLVAGIVAGIIYYNDYRENKCSKGGKHDWVYVSKVGITYQQKQCTKCKKLKTENQ